MEEDKCVYFLLTCYTLSTKKRTSLCQCLKCVKIPQIYFSNVNNLVSIQCMQLVGLKPSMMPWCNN